MTDSAGLPPQWSIPLPNTATEDRGEIRRAYDPLRHPELGYQGCQTLYEAFRRGQTLNPLGPCLGFRAVSTNGMATPFIYSSYTEVVARVDAFAAGLDTLKLSLPTDDNLTLVRSSEFFARKITSKMQEGIQPSHPLLHPSSFSRLVCT